MKNIPEGYYYLKIAYGKDYRKGIVNNQCQIQFTKDAVYEKGTETLDFNKVKKPNGTAAYLAQKHGGQIAGLMLLVPYNDLASVAQRQMPFFPVCLLLWDRFNPAEWLKDYRGPVAVVLAGADNVIPPEFGRRLHDTYAGPKSFEIVPGAGHNDVASQSPAWWRETFAFWQRHQSSLNPAK
jgi:fermentation-respiration switch protein FrsA (DUF1100 family)